MADPALHFEDVSLERGGRSVLAGVDLRIDTGDAWALVGRNGAGKSTLLLAALGTLRPTSGRVRRAPDLEDRSGVGFVPQRCTLDPTLPTTVAEFTELGLVGLGLDRVERRARVAEALDAVELAGHAKRSFWAHSEGQRQRILLARALARRPRHLLMDEPTAALDPSAAARFWRLISQQHRSGSLTVLCATHDLAAIDTFATHVALCVAGDGGGRVTAHPAPDADAAVRDAFGLEARP